ncbi:hypothetical protein QJQ45_028441, partial [Haematococcus lacustris]
DTAGECKQAAAVGSHCGHHITTTLLHGSWQLVVGDVVDKALSAAQLNRWFRMQPVVSYFAWQLIGCAEAGLHKVSADGGEEGGGLAQPLGALDLGAGSGPGSQGPGQGQGALAEAEVQALVARDTAQLERLRSMLTPSGGLAMQQCGLFMMMLKEPCSYEVREAQLAALRATPVPSLLPLVSSPLCDLLAAWVSGAEQDRQTSFVRSLLTTATHLPISKPMLVASRLLSCTVALTKSKQPRVASAAQAALLYWRTALHGLPIPGGSAPLVAVPVAAGRGPSAAAAGGAHPPQGPPSGDAGTYPGLGQGQGQGPAQFSHGSAGEMRGMQGPAAGWGGQAGQAAAGGWGRPGQAWGATAGGLLDQTSRWNHMQQQPHAPGWSSGSSMGGSGGAGGEAVRPGSAEAAAAAAAAAAAVVS